MALPRWIAIERSLSHCIKECTIVRSCHFAATPESHGFGEVATDGNGDA